MKGFNPQQHLLISSQLKTFSPMTRGINLVNLFHVTIYKKGLVRHALRFSFGMLEQIQLYLTLVHKGQLLAPADTEVTKSQRNRRRQRRLQIF